MKFENVTLIKKASVYHDNKVSSRTFYTANNERKTLGFMIKGEYTFNTEAEELMEIISGEMKVKLANKSEFKLYKENTSFIVPANSSFDVIVENFADYCCSYKD